MPEFNPIALADWKREGIPFGVGYLCCWSVFRLIDGWESFGAGIDEAERERSEEGDDENAARPMPPGPIGRSDDG